MIEDGTIEEIRQRVSIDQLLKADGVRNRGLQWHCPFHEDRTPSASTRTGRLVCFTCNDSWDVFSYTQKRFGYDFRQAAEYLAGIACVRLDGAPGAPGPARRPSAPAPIPEPRHEAPQPQERPELRPLLEGYQRALPGSLGEQYLLRRGIPLALAQSLGIGYAARGTWRGRDWKWGRVVFPHTDPHGHLINLYGRAVGVDVKVPRPERHDHLRGPKGYFNAAALTSGTGPLFICEGPFDALAIIAAGYSRTVAIFGVSGWKWAWAAGLERIVLAFDADPTGQQTVRKFEFDAWLHGVEVAPLPLEAFGGCKDASAAHQAGVLDIGEWPSA